jgi:CheY-like chemotaxis protein
MRHYFVGKAKMKTILLLDDESMLLKLLGSVLSRHYNVIKATTAEQALRVFIEHGRQVDLLVADLSLAQSSGIQVALLLRSVIPALPVVLTSGYPVDAWCERDSADLDRLGPNSVVVLQKPFPSQALLKTIRALIGEPQTELARTA